MAVRQRLTRVLGGAAMAAVVVGGVAACAGESTGSGGQAQKVCDVKIAFFGALTGGNAQLGINIRDGAKLAVNEYNEKHKDCQVTLVEKDSEGSPDKAPPLATALAQDTKVLGVVGPAFSGESRAANKTLSESGIVIVTPSATGVDLSKQGWKTFHRGLGSDASQGPAAGRYIKDVLKAQKVYIIDDNSEYGKGLADQVNTVLGSLVVGRDKIQEKQTEFGPLIAKINSLGVDAVYHGGYVREAAPFLRQLRAAGSKAKYVSGDGTKEDVLISGAGKEAAEGAILTCPCVPAEKLTGSFSANYKKLTNREPSTYSAEAYDAANILLKGIEAGNTNRAKLEEFVDKYEGQGITTKFKFQPDGEIDPASVAVWAYVVKDGKIVADAELPKA